MKQNLLALTILGFLGLSTQAQVIQKVVVEEHTGAWCGWCPDGALILEDIVNAEENAIAVSIHQGDAMQIPVSSSIRSFYSPAFPQATINRAGAPISRANWTSAVNVALQKSPLASVSFDSVSLDPGSRELTARIKVTFLGDTTGQMRVNLYVLEDGLTGTGSQWDQVNYLNTQQGHPLYGAGNPLTGYIHNHVLREALGGAWGTAGSIPSSVAAGSEYTHTFVYEVPNAYNIDNMHLVAMVNYHGGQQLYSRPTLNAEEMPLAMAVGVEEGLGAHSAALQLSPNPAQDRLNVSFSIPEMGKIRVDLFNQVGQHVSTLAEGFTNSGLHTITWLGQDSQGREVPTGMYFVRLTTEQGETRTQKLMWLH